MAKKGGSDAAKRSKGKGKSGGKAKAKSDPKKSQKPGKESQSKPKKGSKSGSKTKGKSKPKGGAKKGKPKGAGSEPTLKGLSKALEKVERENNALHRELKELRSASKGQKNTIRKLEGKLDTRIRREEVVMKALGISSRTKMGENGAIGELNRSILKTEEYLLHMGKRIDNILSAIKNHREYLIRLNKKVYKADAKKLIEIEIEIINNTLSIMALSGFDINKSIFTDTKRIKKMIAKEDVDLTKIKKSMERLESKFDDEMERFDYESIFRESHDIPGYR